MGGDRRLAEFLLHGVTGSGKTEVYLQAAQRPLEQGKTVIILVPEIALTPQALARFSARFGDIVAVMHSGMSAGNATTSGCGWPGGRPGCASAPARPYSRRFPTSG